MGSPSAVVDGSTSFLRTSEAMHPRDWVMAQTGLSAATRDALSVLVSAYGGLQVRDGEFYVLQSRVEPHLRTGFRTFKNYLSKLHKVGLLEILSRGPNQYGPKTIWRMRLDVFCRSAQMAMNLDAATDSLDGEREVESAGAKDGDAPPRKATGPGVRTTQRSVSGMIPIQDVNVQLRLLEEKYVRRVTELEDIVVEQGQTIAGLIEEVRILNGGAQEAGEDSCGSLEAGLAGSRPAEHWQLKLVDAVSKTLEEIQKEPLSQHQKKRLRRAERAWRSSHEGAPVPNSFISYAVDEAYEKKVRRFPGYVVSIIERRVREADVSEIVTDGEDTAVQSYLRRKGLMPVSRY